MPVVNPATLDTFFKRAVYKKQSLLKNITPDLIKPVVIKTRISKSTWLQAMGFTGRLTSARTTIACQYFLVAKEPILIFGLTWPLVQKYTNLSLSHGRAYLDDISSTGKSLFFTMKLSDAVRYALRTPNMPRDIKMAILKFDKLSKLYAISSSRDLKNNIKTELNRQLSPMQRAIASGGKDTEAYKLYLRSRQKALVAIQKVNDIKQPDKFIKSQVAKIQSELNNKIPNEYKVISNAETKINNVISENTNNITRKIAIVKKHNSTVKSGTQKIKKIKKL